MDWWGCGVQRVTLTFFLQRRLNTLSNSIEAMLNYYSLAVALLLMLCPNTQLGGKLRGCCWDVVESQQIISEANFFCVAKVFMSIRTGRG